jgi:hypothetical protein
VRHRFEASGPPHDAAAVFEGVDEADGTTAPSRTCALDVEADRPFLSWTAGAPGDRCLLRGGAGR